MLYVNLPDHDVRPLPFYLAMEEYVATKGMADKEPLFFMWQVRPTVIFGRCQIGSKEVNLDYCRKNDIEIYRRKSGGGCVYADMDNIMFSFIDASGEADIQDVFRKYTSQVASFLRSLGLDAESNSRNDVTISGRKVSGYAFYRLANKNIAHGTMLFSTDMRHMLSAITPSKSKLESKGVQSVMSHITTISEHLDTDIEKFKTAARQFLCSGEITLSESDVKNIETLSLPYFSDEWRFGLDMRKGAVHTRRIEGVGEFMADVLTDEDGLIRSVNLAGDFFLKSDLQTALTDRLCGIPLNPEAVAGAMERINVSDVVAGLSNKDFVKLICNIP